MKTYRGSYVKRASDNMLIISLLWFFSHSILFRLFVDYPSVYRYIVPFSDKTMARSFWVGLALLFLARVLHHLSKSLRMKHES